MCVLTCKQSVDVNIKGVRITTLTATNFEISSNLLLHIRREASTVAVDTGEKGQSLDNF
jgi:hypothetical protein